MDTRRFIIENPPAITSGITIEGAQANHIRNVLRMKPGSEIILSDGAGAEYRSEIKSFNGNKVIIEIIEKKEPDNRKRTSVSIALGFLKENKIDDLIRPLTELGTDRIIPFISGRSISRPDFEKIKRKTERWNKIAGESIKQCRRLSVPEILCLNSLEEVIDESETYNKKIIFYEKSEGKSLFSEYADKTTEKPRKVIILIGPEGGFSRQEFETAVERGFESYSLSNGILRAETAVISSAAIVQYLFNV